MWERLNPGCWTTGDWRLVVDLLAPNRWLLCENNTNGRSRKVKEFETAEAAMDWAQGCGRRAVPAMTITLHQTAPWNRRLRNPYRTRYAQVGDRYFKVEADRLNTPWFVHEIDSADDIQVQVADDARYPLVAIVFSLDHARLAIQMRLDGATYEEIRETLRKTPRPGTGRNHPRHVANRRARYAR